MALAHVYTCDILPPAEFCHLQNTESYFKPFVNILLHQLILVSWYFLVTDLAALEDLAPPEYLK